MSDTTPRDQLAALLADDWAPDRDPILTAMFRDYAQTILDAGWRPPARTVTTVEELDALPVGSIVRDVERSALDEKWDDNMWAEVAYESTFSSSSIHTPATVLWEPEEGEGCEAIPNGWESVPTLEELRAELAGHDLMCWCQLVDAEGKRVPCLADVLLCVANRWDRS